MKRQEIIEAIWTIVWSITQATFIVLKLFKVITWSWWWVWAPVWGLFAFIIVAFLITAIIVGIYYMVGVMRIYWNHWRGKI